MADLYNLLDELDEHENEDAFVKERPSMAPTEATEGESEWGSPGRSEAEVPLALQEARLQYEEEAENENDASGDTQLLENELYGNLHRRWFQERHCPELLEYDEDMVQELKIKLDNRQEWIEDLEGNNDNVAELMATVAQMDLDRTKFVLSDWLTRRLSKIEAHPLYMREKVDHLSDGEIAYLKKYGLLYHSHLENTVLYNIPEAWQRLDEPNMIDRPDYDAYHFWLVKDDITLQEQDHEEGACLVAKYREMRKHMREGKVELQL